jgi:hypothetical protein
MATTTGGTTYVTSTDLVANYPTASLALANRVDVVASGGPGLVKTAGYTITVADILGGNKFLYNSASPGTFTLPTSSLVDGMVVNVAQIGAGALTVSGGTIVGSTVTTAQYQGLSFVYVASGTTWYSIAPNATAPGLALVTPTSIANSGGSASASGGAVTFTGVSSISLNGVFTGTFDNYLIETRITPGASLFNRVRLRASGTDSSANYTETLIYQSIAGAPAGAGGSTTQVQITPNGSGACAARAEVFSPYLASPTVLLAQSFASGSEQIIVAASNTASTQFDGFTLYPSTSTITGVVRVYGYRN